MTETRFIFEGRVFKIVADGPDEVCEGCAAFQEGSFSNRLCDAFASQEHCGPRSLHLVELP